MLGRTGHRCGTTEKSSDPYDHDDLQLEGPRRMFLRRLGQLCAESKRGGGKSRGGGRGDWKDLARSVSLDLR